MTGLDAVVRMRENHLKPGAVFIDLGGPVLRDGRPNAVQADEDAALDDESNIVHVVIAGNQALSEIDFRSLTGLVVHLFDNVGNARRHHRAAALIAAVRPAHLVMPVWEDGDVLAVHQRRVSTDDALPLGIRVTKTSYRVDRQLRVSSP